ncbi:MAG: ACT domain-containing protein [Armatimonadetes bacterium]|nr:ACT domain-containing protein [Armatimonadota bacterium]
MTIERSRSVVRHRREGSQRVGFEKERGVSSVSCQRELAHVIIEFPLAEHFVRHRHQLKIFRALAQAGISISLFKLHKQALSFIIHRQDSPQASAVLREKDFAFRIIESMALVNIYAPNMRALSGVMANIVESLMDVNVPIVQTGDSYNSVMCLVSEEGCDPAIKALKERFGVEEETGE